MEKIPLRTPDGLASSADNNSEGKPRTILEDSGKIAQGKPEQKILNRLTGPARARLTRVYSPSSLAGTSGRLAPIDQDRLRSEEKADILAASQPSCPSNARDAIMCIITSVASSDTDKIAPSLRMVIDRSQNAIATDLSCEAIMKIYREIIPTGLNCDGISKIYRVYPEKDHQAYPDKNRLLSIQRFFTVERSSQGNGKGASWNSYVRENGADIFDVERVYFKADGFSGVVNYSVNTRQIADVEILFWSAR